MLMIKHSRPLNMFLSFIQYQYFLFLGSTVSFVAITTPATPQTPPKPILTRTDITAIAQGQIKCLYYIDRQSQSGSYGIES